MRLYANIIADETRRRPKRAQLLRVTVQKKKRKAQKELYLSYVSKYSGHGTKSPFLTNENLFMAAGPSSFRLDSSQLAKSPIRTSYSFLSMHLYLPASIGIFHRHPGKGACYRTLCHQLFWTLDRPSICGHALRSFGTATFLGGQPAPSLPCTAMRVPVV